MKTRTFGGDGETFGYDPIGRLVQHVEGIRAIYNEVVRTSAAVYTDQETTLADGGQTHFPLKG